MKPTYSILRSGVLILLSLCSTISASAAPPANEDNSTYCGRIFNFVRQAATPEQLARGFDLRAEVTSILKICPQEYSPKQVNIPTEIEADPSEPRDALQSRALASSADNFSKNIPACVLYATSAGVPKVLGKVRLHQVALQRYEAIGKPVPNLLSVPVQAQYLCQRPPLR